MAAMQAPHPLAVQTQHPLANEHIAVQRQRHARYLRAVHESSVDGDTVSALLVAVFAVGVFAAVFVAPAVAEAATCDAFNHT